MRKGILSISIITLFLASFVTIDEAIGAEDSTYNFSWLDPDKEVYVLQNRKYRKANRLYLSLGWGKQVSGAFVDSTHIHGRMGYFFHENWGITLFYSSHSGSENETASGVRANSAVPFRRIMESYQGGLVQWSPFYSKLNTFNTIFYYDLIFGIGGATLDLLANRSEVNTAGTTKSETNESYTAFVGDVTMRFFISKGWTADLHLTGMLYNALNGAAEASSESTEISTSHFDATFSIGYTF